MKPSLLISFVYLPKFLEEQKTYVYRDWVLDSGAFSALNSGVQIDLVEYTETCQKLLRTDPTLTEVFALDVIGDHEASLRNCEYMWKHGVPAIPTYHTGSPDSALKHIAKDYPKIAIGGVAKAKGEFKTDFAAQCFARVWPKKIHGFGYGAAKHVLGFPFHSTDATNWELGPCAFGWWNSFGKMSVRGSTQNLRSEIEFYLKLERQAQSRWKKEMTLLDSLPTPAPTVKLAVSTKVDNSRKTNSGLQRERPKVRLSVTPSFGKTEVCYPCSGLKNKPSNPSNPSNPKGDKQ